MSNNVCKDKRPFFTEGDIVHEYYETYDYDKLDILEGNRDITASAVSKLADSIENNGYTLSIGLVNGEKKVLDGQTRLAALKLLRDKKGIELPFYYAIKEDATIDTCALLNSNMRNWKLSNHIHAATKSDKNPENYIKLEELCKEYKKIPARLIAAICLNIWFLHSKVNKIVIDREFEFKVPIEKVREKLDLITEFLDCKDKFPNDLEVVSRVLIFVVDVLKKDKDLLHARIKKEIQNRGVYESKRPKNVLEILEKVFYNGDKKSKQETISWESLYEIYYQNENIDDIKPYLKKTTVKTAKKKASEPDVKVLETPKENTQEVVAKVSSKKIVAKKSAAPVKDKKTVEAAPKPSDDPAPTLKSGRYIDMRALLYGDKKPKS